MNTYALYDTLDNECLVAMGSMKELAEYTGATRDNIKCCLSRNMRVLHRYEVAKIEEDDDEV